MRKRLLLFVVIAHASITDAATYNFHFNNTEQGDSSVANPQLTVTSNPGDNQHSTDRTTNEPAIQASNRNEANLTEPREKRLFHLSGEHIWVTVPIQRMYHYSSDSKMSGTGFGVGLGFLPSESFGVSVQYRYAKTNLPVFTHSPYESAGYRISSFAGGVDFYPIVIPIGSLSDAVKIGANVGYSVTKLTEEFAFESFNPATSIPVKRALTWGVKTNIRFGNRAGIQASYTKLSTANHIDVLGLGLTYML